MISDCDFEQDNISEDSCKSGRLSVKSSPHFKSNLLLCDKGSVKLDEQDEFTKTLEIELTRKRYTNFARKFKELSRSGKPFSSWTDKTSNSLPVSWERKRVSYQRQTLSSNIVTSKFKQFVNHIELESDDESENAFIKDANVSFRDENIFQKHANWSPPQKMVTMSDIMG